LEEKNRKKKINFRLKIGEFLDRDIGGVPSQLPTKKIMKLLKVPLEKLPIKLPEKINLNTNGNPLDTPRKLEKNYY